MFCDVCMGGGGVCVCILDPDLMWAQIGAVGDGEWKDANKCHECWRAACWLSRVLDRQRWQHVGKEDRSARCTLVQAF